MNILLEQASSLAIKAASYGGDLLLLHSAQTDIPYQGSHRALVTAYDKQVDHTIAAILKELPYPILSEESGPHALNAQEPTWIVDPIDGTVNFLHGLPLFGVSIGLYHQGQFLLGAVAMPALLELFFTHGDQTAFFNGRPLLLKENLHGLSEALIGITLPGQPDLSSYVLFDKLNRASHGVLRLGSAALTLCYVAAGRLNAAYGVQAKIWDVAAALAIARCAGYTVWTHFHENNLTLDFIVGPERLVDQLLALFEL